MVTRLKKEIIIIEANTPDTSEDLVEIPKKRVAAYARVSTDSFDQQNSIEAQKAFFERYIQENDSWIYAGIYADAGISGMSFKHRPEFNRMISDAVDGKIDLILVKSLSRFARNTVDSLNTIRKLREHGVSVYFQKENIDTMDSKGEFLITLMSSFAQEESRSLSENVTWGKRRQFAKGHYGIGYSTFLGYCKGYNGELEVIPNEAVIVRYIYLMFLQGRSTINIAEMLTAAGIPKPNGKVIWRKNFIRSILTNEKYYGAALLQKSYTVDYLRKKMVKNTGQLPQYYIPNDHEGIVSKRVYDLVQEEIKRRSAAGLRGSFKLTFSGKIVCGDCGGIYGSKTWHSTSVHKALVWKCNNKHDYKCDCKTLHVYDRDMRNYFLLAVQAYLKTHPKIIRDLNTAFGSVICDRKKYGCKEERLQKIAAYLEKFTGVPTATIKFDDAVCSMVLEGALVTRDRKLELRFFDGSASVVELRPRKKYE